MKHVTVSVLAAFVATCAPFASAQISPEAEQVIAAYNEATGGVNAKQSIQSLVQTGVLEMAEQGIKVPMTVYFRYPDSLSTVTEIPDVGTIRVCITEGTAWEDNSITGFRMLEGTELQQAVKEACLFPEIKISEHYAKATLQESRSDGMITVVLIDNDGFEETWYFDPFTHYLTEVQRVLDAGVRGSYRVKMKMGNYQPVGGDIIMPLVTETSTPAFKITTRLEATEINGEIPDYIFMKPEGN